MTRSAPPSYSSRFFAAYLAAGAIVAAFVQIAWGR